MRDAASPNDVRTLLGVFKNQEEFLRHWRERFGGYDEGAVLKHTAALSKMADEALKCKEANQWIRVEK